jgi:ABC-type uncharacterized transport system permease subunit
MLVFCASGAIAGLAGMAQVSGFTACSSLTSRRVMAWALISWLAGGDPLGILLMACRFGHHDRRSMLQITIGLPYAVINLLLAFTLFVVLARPVLPKLRKAKTA